MIDYQKELEERRKRDTATAAAARKHLTAAMTLLGFTVEPYKSYDNDPEGRFDAGIDLTARKGDETLFLRTHYHKAPAGRVEVSTRYPGPKSGGDARDYGAPKPSASLALDKTPEKIAAEVGRRILAEYRVGLEIVRAANAAADAHYNRRAEELERVLGRKPDAEEAREGRATIYGAGDGAAWGNVTAHGDGEVTLDLHSVPVALAAGLMAQLKARGGRTERK